jgi:aerobic carbon-monoxide dehydrogenase large subunit
VVDIDRASGQVTARRFVAVDDCGSIISLAPALLEEISYDDDGNVTGSSFMDYLLPTAVETPSWRRRRR